MLTLPGVSIALNWLFIATFESGLTVVQTCEDRSIVWKESDPRSAWFDVMEALRRDDCIRSLIIHSLKTEDAYLGVNFPDLTFEADHILFRMHDVPVYNIRPVYCRRRHCILNGSQTGQHRMSHRIGWQGNISPEPGSANIERIVEVDND